MILTETELVTRVLAWVVAAIPEVEDNAYDYLPAGKVKGLPDVAVDIVSSPIAAQDEDFALSQIQQTMLHIRNVAINFMVEASGDESSMRAGTLQLRTFVDRIVVALLNDLTLGGRVPMTSPNLQVDYEPAFTVYADGTRGREVTLLIAVAEPLRIEG